MTEVGHGNADTARPSNSDTEAQPPKGAAQSVDMIFVGEHTTDKKGQSKVQYCQGESHEQSAYQSSNEAASEEIRIDKRLSSTENNE
ncbi:hypothetical protein D3C72_2394720 [compost metagenome]